MMITREQFIRGFNAIKASHDRRDAINTAARAAGMIDFDAGDDPVVYELRRQLEERCGDRRDADGPFPPGQGTGDIEYALYEGGEVVPFEGAEPYVMDDAESVWRFWMHSKTGPFRSEAAE